MSENISYEELARESIFELMNPNFAFRKVIDSTAGVAIGVGADREIALLKKIIEELKEKK